MTATASPVTGGSPPTPPATGTTRTVHHRDWDGNRCANCNARLADAGPYCDAGACSTCGGTGITDDGDRLCPECTGRGQS